ncbi:MAG: hypothetical protein KAW67_01395, partial [Candidatus Eisenbacteria sp.]|nr:hypothetical protein [Candidatus Eisenbacteria bacterium]
EKHRRLRERIVTLGGNTSDPFTEEFDTRMRFLSSGPEVAFSLVDEFAEEYDSLVDDFLEEGDWSDKFGRRFVENRITELISAARESEPAEFEGVFNTAIDALEDYSQENTVYVPLAGVTLDVPELRVGGVVLRTMTEQWAQETLKELDLPSESRKTAGGRAEIKEAPFLHRLVGNVCAEFKAVAEPDRARERAEEEARRVVDLLRYVVPAVKREYVRVATALDGEALSRSYRTSIALSREGGSLTVASQVVGPLATLRVSDQALQRMEDVRFSAISGILAKPDTTEFEDAILRGIHWIADALSQPEEGNALLSLITCLETFLSPRDGRPIAPSIGEAAAVLILRNTDDRKWLKSRICSYYRQRSSVTHRGKLAVSAQGLHELLSVALSLTVWMVDKSGRFSSIKDLHDWLEDVRLSCVPPI